MPSLFRQMTFVSFGLFKRKTTRNVIAQNTCSRTTEQQDAKHSQWKDICVSLTYETPASSHHLPAVHRRQNHQWQPEYYRQAASPVLFSALP